MWPPGGRSALCWPGARCWDQPQPKTDSCEPKVWEKSVKAHTRKSFSNNLGQNLDVPLDSEVAPLVNWRRVQEQKGGTRGVSGPGRGAGGRGRLTGSVGLHTRGGGRVPCVIPDHPGGGGTLWTRESPRAGPGRAGPRPQGWGPAGRAAETLRGGWGTLGRVGPLAPRPHLWSTPSRAEKRGCRAPRPGPGPQKADRRPLTTAPGKPPARPPRATAGPRGGVTSWVTASRLSSPQPGPPRVAPGAAPPPSPSTWLRAQLRARASPVLHGDCGRLAWRGVGTGAGVEGLTPA